MARISTSNGDLAFGGIRGFQTSYLVDVTDNNNAFFAQARGGGTALLINSPTRWSRNSGCPPIRFLPNPVGLAAQ